MNNNTTRKEIKDKDKEREREKENNFPSFTQETNTLLKISIQLYSFHTTVMNIHIFPSDLMVNLHP